MTTLIHYKDVSLPKHTSGGFDHADVHKSSGRVFVAHTANGTIEIIDGESARHLTTITGCPEASGVLCAQDEGLVFAAARGAGKVLVLDAVRGSLVREMNVGSKPNGLAWDTNRKHLLVADVEDNHARILDPTSGRVLTAVRLSGKPRWCAYDQNLDFFLVNVREPAGLLVISPESMSQVRLLPVSVSGPHGLDIIEGAGRAFVACDGKAVVMLDVHTGHEIAAVPIAGEPDVIWHNPQRNRLYCAIAKPGVIDVIDTQKLLVEEEIKTEEGAHTFAFDQARQRLYAFLPQSCRAAVYEEV